MGDRLFSVEEANRMLPQIRGIVEELVRASGEVQAPERRIELSRLTEANASSAAMAPLLKPAEAVARLLIDIDAMGIEVKDPATGLIDFPSERDGRVVYLCWRLGEDAVDHWHEVDAGFAGRHQL